MLDSTTLSRIQFGFTMSAHIIYPSLSIGIAVFLVYWEGLFLYTKNVIYRELAQFWGTIFALTFGMGVVSGIVMEFQFGTNWGGFSAQAGPLLGVLFTYEVLTAFFIEAGFLGIMLFGWSKVTPKMHYLATCMVSLGTTVSAFWIMSANSWMQIPQGYLRNATGQFEASNWWSIIFGPASLARFVHMLLSCYLSASLLILAVSAYYLIQKKHIRYAQQGYRNALIALCSIIPLQMLLGHHVGLLIKHYQPTKTAAIEALWTTQANAPVILFAWPDSVEEKNHYEIGIPGLASYLNHGHTQAVLEGLDKTPRHERPPVAIVFWSFRIMVGCGLAMLAIAYTGMLFYLCNRPAPLWFLRCCILSSPLGVIALEMGWICAETGRQPWVIYQLVKTVEVSSPVPAVHVLTSLICIIIVYGILFGYFYFRYLFKVIQQGPSQAQIEDQSFPYLQAFPSKE